MNRIKLILWKNIQPLQWRVLWLLNPKFIAGVNGVIIDSSNNVLLLRPKYWPEGSWGLPTGYAHHGETFEETLSREVREETGYEIEIERLLKLVSGFQLRLEVSYIGKIIGGELKIDADEIIEAKFFSINDLPSGLLQTHKELINEANLLK